MQNDPSIPRLEVRVVFRQVSDGPFLFRSGRLLICSSCCQMLYRPFRPEFLCGPPRKALTFSCDESATFSSDRRRNRRMLLVCESGPSTPDEARPAAVADDVESCFFKRLPIRGFGQRIIGAGHQEHREIVVIAEFLPEVTQPLGQWSIGGGRSPSRRRKS